MWKASCQVAEAHVRSEVLQGFREERISQMAKAGWNADVTVGRVLVVAQSIPAHYAFPSFPFVALTCYKFLGSFLSFSLFQIEIEPQRKECTVDLSSGSFSSAEIE